MSQPLILYVYLKMTLILRFFKDPDTSIEKLLEANNAKIESFSRLKVGEGIEVSTMSFADEVAEQLK